MISKTTLCLLLGSLLLVIFEGYVLAQDQSATHTRQVQQKPRSQATTTRASQAPPVDDDNDSIRTSSDNQVKVTELLALQDRQTKMEKQVQSLTARLGAVESQPDGQISAEDHIPIWGLLAVGLGFASLLVAVGGVFWVRNASEQSIRKALHEAGLL
jgi:hypothetical protein